MKEEIWGGKRRACAEEIEKRRWSFNKGKQKGAWRQKGRFEGGKEEEANEYGGGALGKVFRRPVTMRSLYVNEVYYIPMRVSVRAIRRSLRRQAKSGSVRTCASTVSWTCYYTNQRDNQRAAPICAAARRGLSLFLRLSLRPSTRHSSGRPIGVSFYRGCPSARNLHSCYLPSETFLSSEFLKNWICNYHANAVCSLPLKDPCKKICWI